VHVVTAHAPDVVTVHPGLLLPSWPKLAKNSNVGCPQSAVSAHCSK
jgi:hypothetical protein